MILTSHFKDSGGNLGGNMEHSGFFFEGRREQKSEWIVICD